MHIAFAAPLAVSVTSHRTPALLTRRRPRSRARVSIATPPSHRQPFFCLNSNSCLDPFEHIETPSNPPCSPQQHLHHQPSNSLPPLRRTFKPLHYLSKRPLLSFLLLLLPLLYPAFQALKHASLSQYLSSLVTAASQLPPSRASFLLFITNFFTVLLCFPANMGLMIAAGALLPTTYAFSALFFSKLLAACVAFVLARRVFSAHAHQWLASHPKLRRVLQESGQEGGSKFVILMRLSPFPGFMLNYLLSLTGVTFAQYALGTFVGVFPSVLNLVLLGATAREVGMEVGGMGAGWPSLVLKVVCIASMVTAMVFVTRKINQVLKDDDKLETTQ